MASIWKFTIVLILSSILLQEASATTCPKGQYLVRTHKRSGYYRANGVYVSPTTVSAYCKRYRNYKPAEIHFHRVKRGGTSRSEYKNFSKKEETQIRKVFKKLPKILTGVGKISFYRESRGRYPKNPASANYKNKRITIYDSISEHDMERVVTHELAHFLYRNLSSEEIDSYLVTAEWKKDLRSGLKFFTERKVFVARDGEKYPGEDFANNIEYYLFEKETLKRKNPKIYKWVEKFVGGEGK